MRKKDSYYGAQYQRIAVRRGKKRALVAVAYSMAIAIYHMLKQQDPLSRTRRKILLNTIDPVVQALNRLTKRIESLGHQYTSCCLAHMAT